MTLRYLDIFHLMEARTPEPLREIDVVARLIGIG
jgi:hypothetical protein